jgi:hypothetical protein
MQNRFLSAVTLRVALVSSLTLLAACAPSMNSSQPRADITVADAFEASSTMHFKPYTRSIFSTTDF